MPFQHAEQFRLRRSERLARALLATHILTFVSLMLLPMAWPWRVLIAVMLTGSYRRSLRKPWLVQLSSLSSGQWETHWSDGRCYRDSLTPRRLTGSVIACASARREPILLLSDAFCDADHKKLRALLRHR